jgi:hypothetical protein
MQLLPKVYVFFTTIILQTGRPTLATPSGRMHGVTCTTLTPFVSYSHLDTAHPLCSAFSHHVLTLRRSLAPCSCTVACPTCTARSSLLAQLHSPACHAPHPHLGPRFGRAPRCPLPLIEHAPLARLSQGRCWWHWLVVVLSRTASAGCWWCSCTAARRRLRP